MQQQATHIPVDRPLTAEERSLIRWMLERGKPEASRFQSHLDKARVIGLCPCGCASTDFAIAGMSAPQGALHVLADFLFGDEANLCGVFVFEKNGILAGLEVYGLAVDAPRKLPTPSDLRPFEAAA